MASILSGSRSRTSSACAAFGLAIAAATVINVHSSGGLVFESNWDTAVGASIGAVTDGQRWPNYWEFNNGTAVQLLTVVAGGVNGHNALRVQQRGSIYAANLQIDNVVPPSTDYFVRYYMKNDDTSNAGDHVVTVDIYQYPNLTFMRKYSGPAGWDFDISVYGCGYIYPIGHWGPLQQLARGQWYRFEYHVDFTDANHIQLHPRVYNAAGSLILSDADFQQSDFGSAIWNGRSDWTLASYYAAGYTFCVNPTYVNDFGIGNNGQQGAVDTGLYWYFAAVQIRTDTWPGPVDGTPAPPLSTGIAALYPGDVGIESHPDVVFVERFEENTLTDLYARWTDILNGPTMAFNADVPAGSPGTRSLNIPWVGGGVNNGGHLYKQLSPAIDDTLYVRYYIKYPANGRYHHEGIWVGGYNPPLAWPNPQAGVKPAGDDRFSAAAEQSQATLRFDHYDYWMNMRAAPDGSYWGNTLLNSPNVVGRRGQWVCVEHMVKLNNPVTASNGEHAIWVDGVKVSHVGQGFPNGSWTWGNFTQNPTGAPFEGLRWRNNAALKLNYIWLQNYSPDDPAGFTSSMKFDHVVAAKSYVGCLAPSAPSPPSPPKSLRVVGH